MASRVLRDLQRVDWLAIALCVLVLTLNLRTLAPSILWSDEAEFPLQIAVLGIPHYTGYPLYVLLGKLWTLLIPIGTIAYRVNLLSAIWGTVTCLLVYLAIKRLTGNRLAALAGAATLAVSPAFWQQSSIAGLRTLHTSFVALITLLAIGVLQGWASLEMLTLAVGLSLAHHRMTLFLLPGLAWVVAQVLLPWLRKRRNWQTVLRRLARLVALVVLPQIFYLYLWVRGQWSSPQDFLRYVLAASEAPILMGKSLAQIGGQFTARVAPSLWQAFTPVGLLIALIGLAALFVRAGDETRTRRAMGFYLLIGIPLSVAFASIHYPDDPTKSLTHGLTLMAVALGIGLAELPGWLARHHDKARVALTVLGLALPLVSGAYSFPYANQSGLDWIGPFTLDMMTGVESGSLIMADWSFAWPMRYHQGVEGQRRDISVILTTDATLAEAEAALLAGKPVYTIKRSVVRPWKSVYPMLDAPHNLVRVLPRAPEFTPQPVREPLGDALILTGVGTWPARLTSNQLALVRLYWQTVKPPEHSLALTVRLINSAGDIWTQHGQKLEAAEYSEVAFLLEPSLPVGSYHWQVIVDDTEVQQTLGQVDLPAFEIGRPASPASPESVVVTARPDQPLQSNGWSLLGASLAAGETRPGASVVVPLFWQRLDTGASSTAVRVQLVNPSGATMSEVEGALPANAQSGDLVETRSVIELPRALADGRYRLRVTLADHSVRVGEVWVKDRPHNYRLPQTIQRRTVRLGDRIELAGYTITPQTSPGETVRLTLHWHALNAGTQSHKVFAHVVGTQGQMLVQQDGVPVRWTVPTDMWVKGEFIADEYDLRIPASAAPGAYTVRVGMYDPDSGARLPAIENGQRLTDDAVALTQLNVSLK